MRIIIVTHYFPPEIGAPQARLSALAAAWAATETMSLCLPACPTIPRGWPARLPGGSGAVRGRRLPGDPHLAVRHPERGRARKTSAHLSFMVCSVLLGCRARAADVVLVSSPTFFSIGAGWLLARIKRARLVVEVRDLWPAIFSELGVLTNRPVIALLERLELAAYAAADQVIVVSEGFRADLISRGVPAGKVHTVRNGVPPRRVRPAVRPVPGGCVPGSAPGLATASCSTRGPMASRRGSPRRLGPPAGSGRALRFAFVGDGSGQAAV